jgi:hypothetical protein
LWRTFAYLAVVQNGEENFKLFVVNVAGKIRVYTVELLAELE